MTFSEALVALKAGKKIKRANWGGYWYLDSDYLYEDIEQINKLGDKPLGYYFNPTIIAVLANKGGYAPAQAYQGDMLANDWEVVE